MSYLEEGQWNQGFRDSLYSCRTACLSLGVSIAKGYAGIRGVVCVAGRVTLGIQVADRGTSLPKTSRVDDTLELTTVYRFEYQSPRDVRFVP